MKQYRFLALALALALIAPVLLAVPVSATDFIDAESLQLQFSGDGTTYTSGKYIFSSSDVSKYGRFRISNGSDSGSVHIPVGENINEFYVTCSMFLDSVSVYASSTVYPLFQLQVICYDASLTSLGVLRVGKLLKHNFSGSGTMTLSISGAELLAGTEYITAFVRFCGATSSSASSWYNLSGSYNAVFGFSVHSSEFDWVSSGFDSIGSSDPVPFHFSHEGQSVYLSKDDELKFFVLAEGFAGTDLYARFSFWGGNTKTVQLYYDSSTCSHYNTFQYFFPDINGYDLMWVDFLIDGNVIYSTENVSLYYPQWDGDDNGSGEGSASDSQISESITEVKEDVQAVMDAVGETSDKIDTLTDQVEEEMGVVQDQLEESNNKLEQVVEGVTSLPQKIGDAIMGLFVPSEEDMAGIKDQWAQLLSDRFGAVYDAVAIVDEIASSFKEQTAQGTITFPSVTIPLSGVDFEFGGWEVDVVPDGLEFFIEVVKKAIDIVCTLLFVNGMKARYEKTLEGRG